MESPSLRTTAGRERAPGLLEVLRDFARRNGYARIRLDVIVTKLSA